MASYSFHQLTFLSRPELIETLKPSYSLVQILGIAILALVIIYAIMSLIRKYGWLLVKKEPFMFMELTFPSNTSKSPYSTEQLFSLIHSLAKQSKFIYKLFSYKKSYSLEITASKDRGIRYILVAPVSDAKIIEKGLRSYLPSLKIKEKKNESARKKSLLSMLANKIN